MASYSESDPFRVFTPYVAHLWRMLLEPNVNQFTDFAARYVSLLASNRVSSDLRGEAEDGSFFDSRHSDICRAFRCRRSVFNLWMGDPFGGSSMRKLRILLAVLA
jgi:hypothetical protein